MRLVDRLKRFGRDLYGGLYSIGEGIASIGEGIASIGEGMASIKGYNPPRTKILKEEPIKSFDEYLARANERIKNAQERIKRANQRLEKAIRETNIS